MKIACSVVSVMKNGLIYDQEAFTEEKEAVACFSYRLNRDFPGLSEKEKAQAAEAEYFSFDDDTELRIDHIPL